MPFSEKMRYLWQNAKPYQKTLLLLAIFSVIASFADALTPYLFGKLMDFVLSKGELWGLTFWQVALLWIILNLISLILSSIVSTDIVNTENKIERDSVISLSSHALRLPVSYHYNQKPGETLKIIDRGADAQNSILEMVTLNFMPQLLTMLIAFIIMFTVNWFLSLLMLLTVIIFFIVSVSYKMEAILAGQRQINESYNQLYGHIGDMMANIFAVKTNTAEKMEKQLQEKKYQKVIRLVQKQMQSWFKQGLVQGFLTRLSRIAVVVFAIIMMAQGKLTAGAVVMFIGYLGTVYGPLYMITNNIRQLRRRLVDLDDVLEIRQVQPEDDKAEAKKHILEGEIEFREVSFQYPEREIGILDKVSFRIEAGHTLAIFGATGSGKTTVYSLILKLFDPDQGEILFDGIDGREITRASLRGQIAVVPQDPGLFNESIEDNIRYGSPEATHSEVVAAAKIANAHDFIMALPHGYETKVGERGVKLSGGQVQRIAIARAALRNPKILILDEATSSLDQKTKFEVLDALSRVIAGRTTIIITHDFSAITQKADQIIVLDNGKIIESGTHQDLINKPGKYQELWQMQQRHLSIS